MLRWVGVAIVGVIVGCALYRYCYIPYRFNIAKRSLERDSGVIFDQPDRQNAAIFARRILAKLNRYAACSDDIDLYMIAAANYRTLSQPRRAIVEYEKALTIDHRPEIYFNLGITQIDAGDRESGLQNLVTALEFNPEAGYIDDPQVNAEVQRRIYVSRKGV